MIRQSLVEDLKFTGLNPELMDDIECYISNSGKVDVQEIYKEFGVNPKHDNSRGVKELLTLYYLERIDVKDGIWFPKTTVERKCDEN